MKKTFFLLICVFTIVALVSCDGNGASEKASSKKTTAEVVQELFESGAMSGLSMLSDSASGGGVDAFNSVGPEWVVSSSTDVTYYSDPPYVDYVESIIETGTMISTGKPYRATDIFTPESKVKYKEPDEFVNIGSIDLAAMAAESSSVTLTIECDEEVLFGGLAEQKSHYIVTLSPVGATTFGYTIAAHLMACATASSEEFESIKNDAKSYYMNKNNVRTLVSNYIVGCNVTFEKVIIRGVSYDPEPISDYMNEHFIDYFTDQLQQALIMAIEAIQRVQL